MFKFFSPKKAATARLDQNGGETLDDKPMAIPAGFRRPETLQEQVARLVRHERFQAELDANDIETFDEANDFDMEEDDIVFSKHELIFDPVKGDEIPFDEFMSRQEEYRTAHQTIAERVKRKPATPPTKKPEDAPSAPQNAGDGASDSGEQPEKNS